MQTKWVYTTSSSPWQTANIVKSSSPVNCRLGAKKQSIIGFGGCFNELGWQALSGLPDEQRKILFQTLFQRAEGSGFNLSRVPIGANDFAVNWYSCNETPGDFAMAHFSIERERQCLIPYIRAAMEYLPEMTLFASPWSPPTWVKNPPVFNHGVLRQEPEYQQAYALYLLKFVQEFQAEGIPVRQLHVQNEPDSDQKFPSCVWTGAKLRDFIRDSLGPLAQKLNLDCQLWLGTIERPDYDAWVNIVLSDEVARRYLSGVGFQWAGKGAIQRTALSWPEMALLQTECECGDGQNTWDYARYVFSLMHHYFTNGSSGFVYWNFILPAGGRSTWGWPQNSLVTINPDATYTLNHEFYVMKQFCDFVQAGAHLLSVEGHWAGNTLAFENPDGSIVLVVANPFETAREFAFEFQGECLSALLHPDSINTIRIG